MGDCGFLRENQDLGCESEYPKTGSRERRVREPYFKKRRATPRDLGERLQNIFKERIKTRFLKLQRQGFGSATPAPPYRVGWACNSLLLIQIGK